LNRFHWPELRLHNGIGEANIQLTTTAGGVHGATPRGDKDRAAMDFNIARFDLVSIRLAVLCAELGTLSAAAKLAHCSISAGSQRLSALEDALGKNLFVRDHRGLQVTEAGELFVRHARTILKHLDVLRQQVADVGDTAPCSPPRFAAGLHLSHVHVRAALTSVDA
jgi:molybdenum-dependent DNA-binding transcriptional regulator ModE